MDPSLSISNDPHHLHHPTQFNSFPFPSSNSVPPTNYFYGHNPYANHVFQPQPQHQPQPQPQQAYAPPATLNDHPPPYTDMICAAIASLNEPDGSSKLAISKYIDKTFTNLPQNPSHGALLTHHLKSLKANGVLTMVRKSYKFAGGPQPESVAVAAAAAAAGLEPPRSVVPVPLIQQLANIVGSSGSASQSQKRGRGRPPKPKPQPQPQQQETAIVPVQPNPVQSNGPGEVTVPAKRRPGRPRKDGAGAGAGAGAGPIVQVSATGGIMKRRGRPPGRRAAGRQRKPQSVSTTVSVIPYVANGANGGANGARRRGRPRRVAENSGAIVPVGNAVVVAPAGGEIVAVAPGVKRGRGRPPKAGGVGVGVVTRVIAKPKRGRGRPVGRPRKYPIVPVTGAQDSPAYGELKTKLDLFQEKAKEILIVLKAGVKSADEAVVRAIQDLEGLTVAGNVEPQAMEGVNPEEAAAAAPPTPPTEAETQGGTQGEEPGFEREGGGEQVAAQSQTEAEAMQEALF